MTPAEKRRRNFRDVVAVTTAAIGLAIAILAGYLALGATSENQRDLRDTNATQLVTCQIGNRTRPQLAINTLVAVDAVLEKAGATLEQRREFAAAQVMRLRPEVASRTGSLGQRDCNGDGQIDQRDWLDGEPPPPLVGHDGLPHLETDPTGGTP